MRPALEYAAPVWQASISDALSDKLEGVQQSSLKNIYPNLSYRLACQCTGLATLRDRRVSLCKAFAKSSLKNPDFQHWFPKKRGSCHSYHLRNNHQRTVPFNRTKTLDKSPINFMLSLINSSYTCLPILYLYGHPPCRKYQKFQSCKSNFLLTTLQLDILIIIYVSLSTTHVF